MQPHITFIVGQAASAPTWPVGLSSTNIIAICALIVAALSLAMTIWQSSVTRRHNRLAVRPIITITHNVGDRSKLTVNLNNDGLGPAIVENVCILLDNIPFNAKQFDEKQKEIFGLDRVGVQYIFTSTTIPAREKMQIIEILCKTQGEYDSAVRFLDRIGLALTYRSIYAEKWSLQSEKPSIFGNDLEAR